MCIIPIAANGLVLLTGFPISQISGSYWYWKHDGIFLSAFLPPSLAQAHLEVDVRKSVLPACGNSTKKRRNIFNNILNTFYLLLYGVVYIVKDHWYQERKEGRKEMFYLTTHSTHFIWHQTWLRTILIVRKETRCRHVGSDYQQVFFYMHHPTDRITHTTAFVTPVVERIFCCWLFLAKEKFHRLRTLHLFTR